MRTPWLLIALAACEHGQTPPDAGDDVDDDGGIPTCGSESHVTGLLLDWDSTTAGFLGVDGARISLRLDPEVGITTPADGRIDLCARPSLPLEFDIDAPGDYLDGTLAIERDAVGFELALRTLTATRAAAFFLERGLTFDPQAAQVVVLMTADRAELSLDLAHDPPQAGNGEPSDGVIAWGAGNAGRYVLFPNVDAMSSTTAVVTGDLMTGPRTTPVAPGKLSLVVISFVLVGP